jgi:hypothetical protein
MESALHRLHAKWALLHRLTLFQSIYRPYMDSMYGLGLDT